MRQPGIRRMFYTRTAVRRWVRIAEIGCCVEYYRGKLGEERQTDARVDLIAREFLKQASKPDAEVVLLQSYVRGHGARYLALKVSNVVVGRLQRLSESPVKRPA